MTAASLLAARGYRRRRGARRWPRHLVVRDGPTVGGRSVTSTTPVARRPKSIRLGLRENLAQFLLLVGVNALVGGMIGQERTVLPLLAKEEFGLTAFSSTLTFIAAFGIVKAATNFFAGTLSDRFGRKPRAASPAGCIAHPGAAAADVGADVGVGDLRQRPARRQPGPHLVDHDHHEDRSRRPRQTGPRDGLQRGRRLRRRRRSPPSPPGSSPTATGCAPSRSTSASRSPRSASASRRCSCARPTATPSTKPRPTPPPPTTSTASSPPGRSSRSPRSRRRPCRRHRRPDSSTTSTTDSPGACSRCTSPTPDCRWPHRHPRRASTRWCGASDSSSPAVSSDRIGRKPLIAGGMLIQAVALGLFAATEGFGIWAAAAVLIGVGTAMVYPTLLAAIGDVAHPSWRARSVGIYRLWRDGGFAVGALLAGVLADALRHPRRDLGRRRAHRRIGRRSDRSHVRNPPPPRPHPGPRRRRPRKLNTTRRARPHH